jgi:hypothetical protein
LQILQNNLKNKKNLLKLKIILIELKSKKK